VTAGKVLAFGFGPAAAKHALKANDFFYLVTSGLTPEETGCAVWVILISVVSFFQGEWVGLCSCFWKRCVKEILDFVGTDFFDLL